MTINDIMFVWSIVSIPLVLMLVYSLIRLFKITGKLTKTVRILKKYIENLKKVK
jgi:hypothetical protein